MRYKSAISILQRCCKSLYNNTNITAAQIIIKLNKSAKLTITKVRSKILLRNNYKTEKLYNFYNNTNNKTKNININYLFNIYKYTYF